MTVSIQSVPQEVLEHIAFCAATQSPVGPPSGLLPILLSCRGIYQALSLEANPHLYARIFNYEFDTDSAFRRLGPHINVPRVLADELSKRWTYLKRIRSGASSCIRLAESSPLPPWAPSPDLINSLWLALLMMLENDGKNERQLLDYAELDVWLMVYLFDAKGASLTADMVFEDRWPVEDEKNTIAMWLFWFLLRLDVILQHTPSFPHMMPILRLATLAAHRYPVCHPTWTAFLPASDRTDPMMSPRLVTHFSETYRLTPPPLAPAAILSFFALTSRMTTSGRWGNHMARNLQSLANLSSAVRRSDDWDAYWYRCISLGQQNHPRSLSKAYVLGSTEGIWEGIFAYTEFDVYLELLTGDVPSALDQCSLAHYPQTWKLREYYLTEHPHEERATEWSQPLGSGHPLNSHFEPGTRFQELSDSVQIHQPDGGAVRYRRRSSHATSDKVVDVIILGEGHSAWGQFSLYGRVRPLDGLISLSKVYVEGDRGKWLYRGYLVGNTDGHISGRWRDSLSPTGVPGYEGCFAMSRRK